MMKLDSILIILTFNATFWSLIHSVKNNKDKNELTRDGETSKDKDRAESSVDPQHQKFEEMLKPKPKIAKKVRTTLDNKEKCNRSEYMKTYYQNNKEKLKEIKRKYRENNREKRREWDRNYYQNNKEKKKEYRENMKNKKESLKNVEPNLGNIHFDDNEENSFVNTQKENFKNNGKLPIVRSKKEIRFEKDFFNQEEESAKGETETHMEKQNQTVVEEPTKINSISQIDSNEEYYLLDPKKKPEDEDEDV